jgi:hypothetical protein
MPKVSQYTVINDPQDNLVLGGGMPAKDYEFKLDGLPQAVDRRDHAVLAWVVDTETAGQQLEVKVNGTKLTLTAHLPGDAYQTLHEVVEKDLLKPPPALNTVTFTVTSAKGVMRISDVVLWWQYNV